MTRGEASAVASGAAQADAARQRAVSTVLVRVLFLNLLVAGAKLAFGYATGAVSIVSDGFHSLADSTSNVMCLIGLRAARKPPDADHPYGHRKFETLAAGGILVFLSLVIIEVLRNAVAQFRHPTPPTVTVASFVVMLATVAINVLVVRYERRKARELSSELLFADAMHTQSDVLTSTAVIVSLAGVWLGYPILDPIGALLIAGFIGRAAVEIAQTTSTILADHAMIDEEAIRTVVMDVPDVLGCHHIRSRGSADHIFLDLHVWFPAATTLIEAHRLSHVVKDRLMQRYPQIADAIIHIEPPPDEIHGS